MTTLLALAVSLCATAQQQTYNITGTAIGHDGTKVMLVSEDKSPIDSTVVADGKFQLTGPLTVQMAMVKMGGTSEAIILHEKPIQMTFQRVKSERRGKAIEVPEIKVLDDKEHDLLKDINDMQMFEMRTNRAKRCATASLRCGWASRNATRRYRTASRGIVPTTTWRHS